MSAVFSARSAAPLTDAPEYDWQYSNRPSNGGQSVSPGSPRRAASSQVREPRYPDVLSRSQRLRTYRQSGTLSSRGPFVGGDGALEACCGGRSHPQAYVSSGHGVGAWGCRRRSYSCQSRRHSSTQPGRPPGSRVRPRQRQVGLLPHP
eukprot:scaffold2823_cov373-Prasinococcus_capsulatus_cf.AAC.3